MKKWVIYLIICVLLCVSILLYFDRYDVVLNLIIILLPFIHIGLLFGLGAVFYYVGKKMGVDKARKEIKK